MKVIYAEAHSDYYLHYEKEYSPQSGGIEIDLEEKTLAPFVNSETGGIPKAVWNGRRLWFPVCNTEGTTVDEINHLIKKIAPLAERLLSESNVEWDGSNWRGKLSQKGEVLRDKIDEIVTNFISEAELEEM